MDTPVPVSRLNNYDFFASTTNPTGGSDATSTSATSTNINPYFDTSGRYDQGYFNINGAQRVTFYFTRQDNGGNAGSSTFSVQVTPDGTNWYNFNKLISNVATTTPPGSTKATAVLTGTSTEIDSLDLRYDAFLGVRCIVVKSVDGQAICKATAAF